MHKPKYLLVPIIMAALLSTAGGLSSAVSSAEWRAGNLARAVASTGPAAPTLGSAGSFAVLAGSTATNTGPTTVEGNLGVSPGSAVTGFPPGIVTGGTIHAADAVAAQAQNDVTTAYVDLAGRACNFDLTGQDLGGKTLISGVYCFSSSAQLTGALVLDAQGDPSAVFIFKIGSTLTTASGSSVRMINGGNQCNVYWQVGSSATLGTGTTFAGNVLALTSITLTTGARIDGRALARNGAVTMDTNNVSFNVCYSAPTSTPTAGGATSPTPTAVQSATATSAVSPTPTAVQSATATSAVSPTPTAVQSATATSAVSPTPTALQSATATSAVSLTPTPVQSATATSAVSPTPTVVQSATPTTVQSPVPTTVQSPVPTTVQSPAPTSVPTTPAVRGVPGTGGAALLQGEGQSAFLAPYLAPTSAQYLILEPLTDPGLDLYASPVDVRLELRIPSLQISAPVLAVGITSQNVMDAPQGSVEDPVWQKAFWYRGGGIPGDLGTATIAGHVDSIGGRPALFARLKDLRPGDLIIVQNALSGLGARFLVTEMETYSLQQVTAPAVLARIYGTGPVSGRKPQPASDGLSHLTLITCSGDFAQGAYDHRLVVYAQGVQATVARTRVHGR